MRSQQTLWMFDVDPAGRLEPPEPWRLHVILRYDVHRPPKHPTEILCLLLRIVAEHLEPSPQAWRGASSLRQGDEVYVSLAHQLRLLESARVRPRMRLRAHCPVLIVTRMPRAPMRIGRYPVRPTAVYPRTLR